MKGYAKLTAALAAVVMLFIAIGVSSTAQVSAQAATVTIVPTSATTLTTDAKKDNTACSSTGVTSACSTDDRTYTITVTDASKNTVADELNYVVVTVKNADLATVTPKKAADSNAKQITLYETGVNTGIFNRLVTTKHASTGLVVDGGVGKVTAVASTTVYTVPAWDSTAGNDGLAGDDVALTDAQRTTIAAQSLYVIDPATAANKGDNRAITGITSAGVVTVGAAHDQTLVVNDIVGVKPLVESKAFTGNTITATYKPTGTLGISKSITIDNVKATILVNSPDPDLITKSLKTINFNADVTDTAAGFPSKSTNLVANNTAEQKGRVQLWVGKRENNVGAVALPTSAYTAITDGWNLNVDFSSSDLANIGPKVPWWIEAEDLAGNLVLPLSGYQGTTTSASGNATTTTDTSLIGMGDDMLNEHSIIMTQAGVKQTKVISDFVSATGVITHAAFASNPAANTTYEIKGVGIVTVDSTAPAVASAAAVQTGHKWSAAKPAGSRLLTGLLASTSSIRVTFTDASGLDASTVSPSSFTVSGNTIASTLLVDIVGENSASPVQRIPNDVFLTVDTALARSARPTVGVMSGTIKDKAGNAVVGSSFKSTDKLGPGLTLGGGGGVSKKEVKVSITSDEQLAAAPTVALSARTSNTAGTVEACCAGNGTAPVAAGTVSQTAALTYSYKTTIASIPTNAAGADFNVYVTADDTSSNPGKGGHASDAGNAAAVTFELDKKLNGGSNPKVSVSDKVATCTSGVSGTTACVATAGPSVEAVDPMIVTVDWNRRCLTDACTGTAGSNNTGESKEYTRDSYKTVELTKASLKVTFTDGTWETTTFDLATDVTSPDDKRYTIPVSAPKVGTYELTIQGKDLAGNTNLNASTATTPQSLKYKWKVTAALPVKLALSPGWNLISLPFQPANPAINSVIPSTHPADIVMSFDNANQIWLVSRRDATTGLFAGDVAVMTSNTAYFVRTDNFQELSILRPPVATAAAAPPPPPAIAVVPGWNLVPVVSLTIPLPYGIKADSYFGTLQAGANKGWLKAMTFDPLARTWTSVTPGATKSYAVGATNPCTNAALVAADVAAQTEPCQVGAHVDTTAGGGFNTADTVALAPPVLVGKGYWLYATAAGVVIP